MAAWLLKQHMEYPIQQGYGGWEGGIRAHQNLKRTVLIFERPLLLLHGEVGEDFVHNTWTKATGISTELFK